MPRLNAPDPTYPTMKHNFKYATITAIDRDNDTANIKLEDGTEYQDVPIFYHCNPDADERDNGALVGAAKAFSEGNQVVLRKEDGSFVIVGHKNGLYPCVSGDYYLVYDGEIYLVRVSPLNTTVTKVTDTLKSLDHYLLKARFRDNSQRIVYCSWMYWSSWYDYTKVSHSLFRLSGSIGGLSLDGVPYTIVRYSSPHLLMTPDAIHQPNYYRRTLHGWSDVLYMADVGEIPLAGIWVDYNWWRYGCSGGEAKAVAHREYLISSLELSSDELELIIYIGRRFEGGYPYHNVLGRVWQRLIFRRDSVDEPFSFVPFGEDYGLDHGDPNYSMSISISNDTPIIRYDGDGDKYLVYEADGFSRYERMITFSDLYLGGWAMERVPSWWDIDHMDDLIDEGFNKLNIKTITAPTGRIAQLRRDYSFSSPSEIGPSGSNVCVYERTGGITISNSRRDLFYVSTHTSDGSICSCNFWPDGGYYRERLYKLEGQTGIVFSGFSFGSGNNNSRLDWVCEGGSCHSVISGHWEYRLSNCLDLAGYYIETDPDLFSWELSGGGDCGGTSSSPQAWYISRAPFRPYSDYWWGQCDWRRWIVFSSDGVNLIGKYSYNKWGDIAGHVHFSLSDFKVSIGGKDITADIINGLEASTGADFVLEKLVGFFPYNNELAGLEVD